MLGQLIPAALSVVSSLLGKKGDNKDSGTDWGGLAGQGIQGLLGWLMNRGDSRQKEELIRLFMEESRRNNEMGGLLHNQNMDYRKSVAPLVQPGVDVLMKKLLEAKNRQPYTFDGQNRITPFDQNYRGPLLGRVGGTRPPIY